MKRDNHLFEKFVSLDNLRRANNLCKAGKEHYRAVSRFQVDLERKLADLQTDLLMGTYHTGEYRIKNINERGKERKIYVLDYKHRVVQRALGLILEPIVTRRLTADTHASIKDRGIHSALKQVKGYLENDVENTKYCLKIDIRHYFPSVNHEILKEQWRRIIKDKRILAVIDDIIDSVPPDEGLPIGNHFSQVAATLYLSAFDHWVKEYLHIKHYTRYMDDMVFFAGDKQTLRRQFREIDWYLLSNLRLTIKPNWQIFPIESRPLDFVGYRMTHTNTILRKSTFKRLRQRCFEVAKISDVENMTYTQFCSINSFRGWSMHGNDKTIQENYYKPLEGKLDLYHKLYLQNKPTL